MNQFKITLDYAKVVKIKERITGVPDKIKNMPGTSFSNYVDEVLTEYGQFLDSVNSDKLCSKVDVGRKILEEVTETYTRLMSRSSLSDGARARLVEQAERLENYIESFDEYYKKTFRFEVE